MSQSSSYFFPLRRALSTILLGSAAAIALFAFLPPDAASSSPGQEQLAPLNKIAWWVLDKTANGGEAEFLLVLNQQAELSGADALPTKEEKGRYIRDALWKTAQETQAPLLAYLRANKIEHRAYYIVNLVWVKGSRATALQLASRADVARIDGNPKIRNLPAPLPARSVVESLPQTNAPATIEAGVNQIRAPAVWATGVHGEGIVIAGADTGIRWTHSALKSHYRGWDGIAANHNYNWHDSVHSSTGVCGADNPEPCDDHGHGTHTTGTVVGDDGGTNQIGVAPGARFIGCRNMDGGIGSPATYMECMEFFLAPYPIGGTPAQGDPAKAPDITNNSWTCPDSDGCTPTTLQQAVESQRAAGIQMVVAAGNGGQACSVLKWGPAIYEAAYTVGALNTGTNTITSFSSRGPVTSDGSQRLKPDITAPGTATRSSYNTGDDDYESFNGTSMATPHVAGAIALLLSAHPGLRGDVMNTRKAINLSAVHILDNNCDPGSPRSSPNNTYGYGRLDAKNAVDNVIVLNSAVSRKDHAGMLFDVPLPLSGAAGVECRNSNGNHTIVFTFNKNITTGNASVVSGVGSVNGNPTVTANNMSVDLIGVTDAQTITVKLSQVTDAASHVFSDSLVSMRVLVGDTSGNGSVTSTDVSQTKLQSGQAVTAANFRADVNANGAINGTDISAVKLRTGTAVP